MSISRRNASVILVSAISGKITGCGGTSDSKDLAPQSKSVKFAFDNSRNTSTAWTDDKKLILIGTGDFRLNGFKVERGRLSNDTVSIDFIVEAPTRFKLLSTDYREVVVVETSSATLKTIRYIKDNIFAGGIGFYTKDAQTFMGKYNTDTTPTINQLTDIKPVDLKIASASDYSDSYQTNFLARFITGIISSAHAQNLSSGPADELGKEIIKAALGFLPYYAAGLGFYFCGPGTPLSIACAAGAFTITSAIFNPLLARADESPPRLFPRVLPPAGSIPYGNVVYVDDGGCPIGQLKMVTGGNQNLGIPRQISCVPTPATVP